jgi:hypothetical protein
MKLKRRPFIQLCLVLGWSSVLRNLWSDTFAMSAKESDEFGALAPYLDTLIPEDNTPSATQLGVDREVLIGGEKNRQVNALLREGCKYLDELANRRGAGSFAELDENAREDIVKITAEASRVMVPGFFFNYVRDNAFKAYYARPESWRGLGIGSPPQPLGYPDYTQAPKGK